MDQDPERHDLAYARLVNTIRLQGDHGASATIVPERGAIVTSLVLGGHELLYLDEETLRDPQKNVRGGIPVLFPSPGRLTDDRFAKGAMKQHGFARTLPFTVTREAESEATLALADSEVTRAQFPYAFEFVLHYRLMHDALRIEATVTNHDDAELPFGFGLHPYFAVPEAEKAAARIETGATRAFDNVKKEEIALDGIDLTANEIDLHLVDHGCQESALTWFGRTVRLRGSFELTRWVIWTLRGKDFVCLEPWTCPADALNTGAGLIVLPPGDARTLFVEIVLE